MAYVASNYMTNPDAPVGQWACTRGSGTAPFPKEPPFNDKHGPTFCGQCVSYVTTVCPDIPVNTMKWVKGDLVKGSTSLKPGTAIGTFNKDGQYQGHAAIYVGQDMHGIQVYDQWVTGTAKAIGPRTLRFGAHGISNNGDNFHVID